MKKNNSILVLGILSISLLIILSIIQSSTAQRYDNRYDRYRGNYDYNRYDEYNRYNYEQYNYDNRYGDKYADDYNRCIYEQYKKSLGDNYDDDDYYDCDDYYYSETYDFTVRLP